jgi:D-methionine transport system substrate-binding protein
LATISPTHPEIIKGGTLMNKKTWIKVLAAAAAVAISAGALAGCGGSSSQGGDKKELTYSASQGPYSDLFEKGVKPILEKEGYTVKGKNMSDLLQADIALNEGEVDFNVEQHTAYMDNFNQKQNGHLVALTPIPTVLAGIYPGSKTSLDQVADGDTIAIPNDASNTARAYAILQKAGWIKLNPDKDLTTVTKDDIIENPHHLQFTEMKSMNIPSVRTDFDYIVITGSVVYNAKIDPSTALLNETIKPQLLLQLVVNEKNKDAKWAKDIADAYQSPEFEAYMKEHNNGLWYDPHANNQ